MADLKRGRRPRLDRRKWKEYLFCYTMLLFAFYNIVSYLIINLDSVLLAFTIRDRNGSEVFSLNNWRLLFQELSSRDSTIWNALINTLKYFVLGIVSLLLAFVVSYFLFRKIWGYKFFRTVFFLPSMISPVVLVLIFKDIIKVYGILWYSVEQTFGIQLGNLLADPRTATGVILFYTFWSGFGANMLLQIGAMNRIPQDIFEAGKLDGCSSFHEFIYLVVPMCWETLSTQLLLATTGIFTASGPILYFTNGDYNTNTLSFWIFNQVLGGAYNYPTTVGLFFTLLAVPIVLLVQYLSKKVNQDAQY